MTTKTTLRQHAKQGFAFLVIGGVAFLTDAAVYNLLVFAGPNGSGVMHGLPLPAKIIAIVVASVVTYIGNKVWTFRSRNSRMSVRQITAFCIINGIAIGLQLGCLGFSRYVLGLHDAVSDNVSGTFIGQVLATIFRYFTYSRFVFPESDDAKRESLSQA